MQVHAHIHSLRERERERERERDRQRERERERFAVKFRRIYKPVMFIYHQLSSGLYNISDVI
jgi:hypothetical protein